MADRNAWRALNSQHWRQRATQWQQRSWVLFGLLLVAFVINTVAHAPATLGTGMNLATGLILWLLQVFPLLVFIPAMRRELPRALSWMSLLVLIYLPFGIVASTRPVYWSGIVLTLSILAFMISLAYWIQCLKRYHAQRADERHQGAA
jgi:uncharacterized membrane protein